MKGKNWKVITKICFNSATNPSDIFGAETLIDGEVKLIDRSLTESALNC